MTNEIKEMMYRAYREGEAQSIKVEKINEKSTIIVKRNGNGTFEVGNIYAGGKRVTSNIPTTHNKIVAKMMAELTEESIEELKIDIKTEELTDGVNPCYNEINLTEELKMDNNLQEEIRNIVATGEIKGSTPEGIEFEVKQSAGVRKIKFGSEFFTAIGTKRIRVLKSTEKEFNEIAGKKPAKAKVDKPAKAKKSKEPKPAQTEVKCAKCGETFLRSKYAPNQTECSKCKPRRGEKKPDKITVKCETCGKDFETSKFTPNAKQCPECKPRRAKGESKPVEPRKCEVTGEMFTPSKFNPKATISPEGLKIKKLQDARDGRIQTAFDKIREQKIAEGTGASEIQKALEMAWDNEEIHAIPSLIKAVKDHFGVKPAKSDKVTNYEAPQEDQEPAK